MGKTNLIEDEEIAHKLKLEKDLMTITAKRKINRNILDKQINYDRKTDFKNAEPIIDSNFPEKFYFEFEKTPEERLFIQKKEEINSSKI